MIPARLASSRLPEKPLADIGGLPMVVRVAERAQLSGATAVHVATDDARIYDAVKNCGFSAIMTQASHSSGTERLAEAADILGLADDTIVVNVQGDEPLIAPRLISAVAAMLDASPDLPMTTACHALCHAEDFVNPNIVKVVLDQRGHALYFSRAPIPFPRDACMATPELLAAQGPTSPRAALPQDLPVFRHIGIYGYRAGFLRQYRHLAPCALEQFEALEQLRVLWHGHRIGVTITGQAPEAGVDTPADLERARQRWHVLQQNESQ